MAHANEKVLLPRAVAALAMALALVACADGATGDELEQAAPPQVESAPEPEPPRFAVALPPPYDLTMHDTVILNARLINPETGSDLEGFNIGILDGRIAALTRRPLLGERVVDATGLVAAPGFIDVLSFEIYDIPARFKISDGVTTNLLMHGGAADARAWHEFHARRGPLINYGASSFITVMRRNLGYHARSVMESRESIDALVANVRRNIMDGALGISMSPEYTPGLLGEELLALSWLAAELDVATYYHVRYSTPHGDHNSLVAIREVLDLARETGAATHIMHINSTGATFVAEEAFAMIAQAIDEGLDVTACVYPYDFWATFLNSERFAPGWQERFGLDYGDIQIPNTSTRFTAEMFHRYRHEWMLVFARDSMPEEEIRLAMRQPFVFIASDATITYANRSHPRGAGTFARTIGKYARDEGVITLMEALYMMTIQPARRLESASDDMRRKGRLEIGADADIVLFCFDSIIDTATAENPASYSEGIVYVWVNGTLGVERGVVLNVRAGRPVMSRFASPAAPLEYAERTLYLDGGEGARAIAGIVRAHELQGAPFVDLRAAALALGLPFELSERGEIAFGQARLALGETAFESYGQRSHLTREPVIFRGSAFAPLEDLPSLLRGLSVGDL